MSRRTIVIGCLTLLAAAAALSVAGPISPSAGPVASTHKTLTEIEPRTAISDATTPGDFDSRYVISAPGSYYLTGNVVGVANKHGIKVTVSGVTIDLNGFQMVGTGAIGGFDGVYAPNSTERLTVINGDLVNWSRYGLNSTVNGPMTFARRLNLTNNGAGGARLGKFCSVTDCNIIGNGGIGVRAASGRIADSLVAQNTDGIYLDTGGIVSNCVSDANAGVGIITDTGVRVESCVVRNQGLNGISALNGCTIVNCTLTNNATIAGYANIRVVEACRVEGNTISQGSIGIKAEGAGNFIVRNTVRSVTSAFELVSNNVHGQIADRRSPGTPPVSGASALGSIATDPSVNVVH